MTVVRFKMVARRVNMHYLMRETGISTEWGLGSRRFFWTVVFEADPRDSYDNIFIFIVGIRATCRFLFFIFTVFGQFLLCFCDRERYMIWLWIIYLTSTHPKLSKNVSVYCIIPSSLFTTIVFKWAKTVRLQEPSASFCGVLNELNFLLWDAVISWFTADFCLYYVTDCRTSLSCTSRWATLVWSQRNKRN